MGIAGGSGFFGVFGEAAEDEPAEVGERCAGGQQLGHLDGEFPAVGAAVGGIVERRQQRGKGRLESLGDEFGEGGHGRR